MRSIAYKSDLIFARQQGLIRQEKDYLVVRTPSNPSFHWGNFIFFEEGPSCEDLGEWEAIFDKEIGALQEAKHYAFGWDTTEKEARHLRGREGRSYAASSSAVLASSRLRAPQRRASEIAVRPLSTDQEWEGARDCQVACREPEYAPASYFDFKTRQMRNYRDMAEVGLGLWFGAFVGEDLVADLGIFLDDETARYQNVETHADYRRRGICGSLVYAASEHIRERFGPREFVIVADEDYHACGIYKSLGFELREYQNGASWHRS